MRSNRGWRLREGRRLQLSKADYFELVAKIARLQVAQAQAQMAIEKAQRPLRACLDRLATEYQGFPVDAPHGWRWNDATCEIDAEA